MGKSIDFAPHPTWQEFYRFLFLSHSNLKEPSGPEGSSMHSYTGSGKAAIASVLGYLRHTGVFKDKMSEILVPQWLGIPIYQSMFEFAFPVKTASKNISALLVYHQFGFPQKMDQILDYARAEKIVVIEDCAHAYGSRF